MSFLQHLLGARSKPKPQPPDAEFLGDFLVFELLEHRFGLRLDDFTRDLPPTVRELARVWVLLYLAWVYRMLASAKHGLEFSTRMMSSAKARLAAGEPPKQFKEFTGHLATALDFWFDRLDEAAKTVGTRVPTADGGSVELPVEWFAAMSFLALDASSPYYRRAEFPDRIDADVGIALCAAKDAALPLIERAVQIGRPLPESPLTLRAELIWSPTPACHERHLQRRYKNPLFPRARRAVTQEDIDAARLRDSEEAARFRVDINALAHRIDQLPDPVSLHQALEIRKQVDDLIDRAAELGGDLAVEEATLAEIYAGLITYVKTVVSEHPELVQKLGELETMREKRLKAFHYTFSSQLNRQDSPIQPADVIPALLSEEPETIALFISNMSQKEQALAERLRASALRLITQAEAAGATVERADEKLQALGIHRRR